MGGWESFAKAFKDIFEDLKEIFTGLVQGIVKTKSYELASPKSTWWWRR